jgi:hypothetical protein
VVTSEGVKQWMESRGAEGRIDVRPPAVNLDYWKRNNTIR